MDDSKANDDGFTKTARCDVADIDTGGASTGLSVEQIRPSSTGAEVVEDQDVICGDGTVGQRETDRSIGSQRSTVQCDLPTGAVDRDACGFVSGLGDGASATDVTKYACGGVVTKVAASQCASVVVSDLSRAARH